MPSDLSAPQQEALRGLATAVERLTESQAHREEAILACAALGVSYRTIAEQAGVSHQRVGQIVRFNADAVELLRETGDTGALVRKALGRGSAAGTAAYLRGLEDG